MFRVVRGAGVLLELMPEYSPHPLVYRENGRDFFDFRDNNLWPAITTRGGRLLEPSECEDLVRRAWKYAEQTLGRGIIHDDDQPVYGAALADMWIKAIADGRVALSEVEAAVVDYVIAQMDADGRLRVRCGSRHVADFIGAPNHMRVVRALKDLSDGEVLVQRDSGTSGAGKGRRSAVYSLAPLVP